jgi:hypothetical protein
MIKQFNDLAPLERRACLGSEFICKREMKKVSSLCKLDTSGIPTFG